MEKINQSKNMDRYCDPCFKDDTMREVVGYCPKCVEFYCQSCLKTHRRLAATERHKILQGADMPSCQADKPVRYWLCDKHESEQKDKYCLDDKLFVCRYCISSDHKSCNVVPIEKACKKFSLLTEENEFSNGVSQLLNYITHVQHSVKSNINKLKEKKQVMQDSAKATHDRIIEEVGKSFQEFNESLEVNYEDQKHILEGNGSEIEDIHSLINSVYEDLQRKEKKGDPVRFLQLSSQGESIFHALGRIESLDLAQIDLTCTFNELKQLAESHKKLGDIAVSLSKYECDSEYPEIHFPFGAHQQEGDHPAVGSSEDEADDASVKADQPMKPKSILKTADNIIVRKRPEQSPADTTGNTVGINAARLKPVTVKVSGDTRDCCIAAIDVTNNGNMILLDNNNFKVKLMSPDGRLLSFIQLDGKGKDVAVINETEAAISMPNREIYILDISSNQILLKRTVKLDCFVWGMCAYKGNLIITCNTSPLKPRAVKMVSSRGNVSWSALNDSTRRRFRYPRFLTVNFGSDSDTVIVTDRHKMAITVLQAATGQLVNTVSVDGRVPQGVTVDRNENSYITYSSDDICVWSKNMQNESLLIADSKTLKSPTALVYNAKQNELLITSTSYKAQYCDIVHRYQLTNEK